MWKTPTLYLYASADAARGFKGALPERRRTQCRRASAVSLKMPKKEKKDEPVETAESRKKKKALAEQAAKLVDVKSQIAGFDAKAWLKETLKYISWLLAFTMSIFATRGAANQYNYVDLWRSAAQTGMPYPFATQVHFWTFIQNGMLPMLGPTPSETTDDGGSVTGFSFPSSEGDYGLALRNLPSANGSLNRLALNGNVIVDGIWIRQLRVSAINCTQFGKLAQVSFAAHCGAIICVLLLTLGHAVEPPVLSVVELHI